MKNISFYNFRGDPRILACDSVSCDIDNAIFTPSKHKKNFKNIFGKNVPTNRGSRDIKTNICHLGSIAKNYVNHIKTPKLILELGR